jgi:hypothetical protein
MASNACFGAMSVLNDWLAFSSDWDFFLAHHSEPFIVEGSCAKRWMVIDSITKSNVERDFMDIGFRWCKK